MQTEQTQMKFKDWNILLEQGEIQIYPEDNFATLDFNSKANSSIGTQQFPCNTLGEATSLYKSLVKGDVAVNGSWIKINNIKYNFDDTKSLVIN